MIVLSGSALAADLPSWREGLVKAAVVEWLAAVTDQSGGDFIPVPERVAVFDLDGTSWCERPKNSSGAFQVAMARNMAEKGEIDPDAMPFRAWFAGDRSALREYGYREAYTELNALFAGMDVTAYRDSALSWLDRNWHPRFEVPYTALYYQPMSELRDLLTGNGFQVWIVTGSTQDFVRSFTEEASGVPPERVIGTWTATLYEEGSDGVARVVRDSTQTYNGHEFKPAHIEERIGRRPVFAAGNSNNDQAMCRYAVTGPRRGLALWIHHDDGEREYEYGWSTDRIGGLVDGHSGAHEVSIRQDWLKVFPGDLD